jgi:signal transduction histidine kinase
VLAKLPFRSKLVLVVSVPLLVLILFAGVAIKGRFDALVAQEQYGHLVGPFQSLTAVARSVANEGVASEAFVGEQPGSEEMLDQARAATDAAVASLQADVGSLSGTVSDETAETAELVAADLDERVETYRRAVDGGSAWVGFFSPIAREALGSATNVARDTDDRTLAAGLGTVLDLDRRQVALSDESAIVMHYFRYASADGDIGPVIASTGAGPWVDAIAQQQAGSDGFAESATDAQLEANAAAGGNNLLANPIRADSFDGSLPSSLTVAPADYLSFYTRQQDRLDEGRRAVQAVVNDTASAQQADARTETYLVALGTALVILIVLALTWAIVRAVNRPLRALTRAARDVSERRLPRLVDTLHRGGELTPDQLEEMAPIRVESQDEIGELAKAFSTIQQVTVAVAEEQSELLKKGIGDLYVNLARRNQSLLDRQISLLDDMEAKVEDADELSSLFELDHLATRMRRNAESLLVMSGAAQPRQWGSAIAALDVVRAAAAEIADFARVTYFGFDGDAAVAGNAVADVTHLLAELLENATAFSPPQTPVVVAGRAVDRRYIITITDEGIGMDEPRVASANALLARPPAPGLALSRTLGLHVVAHLAARYGIGVQLRRAPGSGVTAVVALPAMVLARVGEPDAPATGTAPEPEGTERESVRAEPVGPEPVRRAPVVVGPPSAPTEDPGVEPPPAVPVPEPVGASAPTAQAATPQPDGDAIAWRSEPAPEGMPRRAPTTAATPAWGQETGNGGSAGNGLTTRTPGTHLTHQPGATAAPTTGDVRPRPERVQDLLSRHDRGKRDGRVRAPDAPPAPPGDDA